MINVICKLLPTRGLLIATRGRLCLSTLTGEVYLNTAGPFMLLLCGLKYYFIKLLLYLYCEKTSFKKLGLTLVI